MWIRSQDKKRLVNANMFQVDRIVNSVFESDTNTDIELPDSFKIWTDSDNYECTLGEYLTEERALEVLDEIHQGLITATQFDSIVRGERITSVSVYQMPKE